MRGTNDRLHGSVEIDGLDGNGLVDLAEQFIVKEKGYKELYRLILKFAQEKEGIMEDILGYFGYRF